jgi:hypothetical protein
MYFAADCLVNESLKDPLKYINNNVRRGLHLLEAINQSGVRKIVFSSSCAVYGDPIKIPISEDHPCLPTKSSSKRITLPKSWTSSLSGILMQRGRTQKENWGKIIGMKPTLSHSALKLFLGEPAFHLWHRPRYPRWNLHP